MPTQILPHQTTAHNGQVLLIQLTRPVKTTLTGAILPANKLGKVLTQAAGFMLVDFGLVATLQCVPVNAGYYRIVRG